MKKFIRGFFVKDLTKEKAIDFVFKSFIVAFSVSLLTLFFEATIANLLIFASLAASAVLLVNTDRYKLVNLRVIIESYIFTALIAITVIYLFRENNLGFYPAEVFFILLLSSLAIYFFNCIHPPAISCALAFSIEQSSFGELALLVVAIIVLLIIIRMLMYLTSDKLLIKNFHKEFLIKKRFKKKVNDQK